jgi:hypothetical protein
MRNKISLSSLFDNSTLNVLKENGKLEIVSDDNNEYHELSKLLYKNEKYENRMHNIVIEKKDGNFIVFIKNAIYKCETNQIINLMKILERKYNFEKYGIDMTSFNKEDLELFISAVNYAMKMC